MLSLIKNTKRAVFYIGHFFGRCMLNLNDYMPSFEIISYYDPFNGKHPFIKVPTTLTQEDIKNCLNMWESPAVLLNN